MWDFATKKIIGWTTLKRSSSQTLIFWQLQLSVIEMNLVKFLNSKQCHKYETNLDSIRTQILQITKSFSSPLETQTIMCFGQNKL